MRSSECYPIVFVNGVAGVLGWTNVLNVPPLAVAATHVTLGRVSFVDSHSYPQPENLVTLASESSLSTLAHELGHAACLDPVNGSLPAVFGLGAGWGDPSGHPIAAQPEDAVDVNNLKTHVMAGGGPPGSGAELISARENTLITTVCKPLLHFRFSPSFSIRGPDADAGKILWAPFDDMSTVTLGIDGDDVDGLSYGHDFRPGGIAFEFSVDEDTLGLAGSAVAAEAALGEDDLVGDEFGAPPPPPVGGKGNIKVLDAAQLGLDPGDDLDALEDHSPFEPVNFSDVSTPAGIENLVVPGTIDVPMPGTMRLGAVVFFSVGPGAGGGRDPGIIYAVVGDSPNPPKIFVYAPREALGLAPGDDIDAICVKHNFSDTGPMSQPIYFASRSTIRFSLSRTSTNVVGGAQVSAADILRPPATAKEFGRPNVAVPAANLGLRPEDDIDALKCFTPMPRPGPAKGLPGKRLVARSTTTAGRLVFLAKGEPITPPPPGSAEDPTIGSGAVLRVRNAATGESVSVLLSAAGWSVRSNGPIYRYKNTAAPDGDSPCRTVVWGPKLLKAVCKASLLSLDEPTQGSLDVQLSVLSGVCTHFGAPKKDEPGKFISTNQPDVPDDCPSPTSDFP